MMKILLFSCLLISILVSGQDFITGKDDLFDNVSDFDDEEADLNETAWDASMSPMLGAVRLIYLLTDSDRYDRHERPSVGEGPVNVSVRTYVYVMSSIEGRQNMKLKVNMKVQLSYRDPRLQFSHVPGAPSEIAGDSSLLHRLWTPHIFLANERYSFVMGSGLKDVLIRVLASGRVLFITRFSATVVCTMTEGRFPFDQQECPLLIESWIDESDDVVLSWASEPVIINDEFGLTTFTMLGLAYTEELVTRKHLHQDIMVTDNGTEATYYSLRLNFSLARLHGFFIMDYYLPSILLVVISWVSFWLEPDIVPARVLLGSSTMLTFIMLAVQTDKAPVSYLKASEIWFVGCTSFIFGSLVEFAFVNTIWRSGEDVRLKKVSTRHILKSTLSTPRQQRDPIAARPRRERYAQRRTSSLPDLGAAIAASGSANSACAEKEIGRFRLRPVTNNPLELSHPDYLQTLPSGSLFRPMSRLAEVEEMAEDFDILGMQLDGAPSLSISGKRPGGPWRPWRPWRCLGCAFCSQWGSSVTLGWTQMTAKEVSAWIDKRSRLFFPLAFLAFNIFYWAFVTIF